MTTCERCGQEHVGTSRSRDGAVHEFPSCTGHVVFDRDKYEPGKDRVPLDQPRPCQLHPMRGQSVCHMHGGRSANARRGAEQRQAVEAIEADARKLLAYGSDEPVDDPLALIHEMTQMSYALVHSAASRVNALDEIRYTGGLERDERGELRGTGTEQLRAEVQLLERNIDRTARLAELLVKHRKPADVDDAKSVLTKLGEYLGVSDT